MSGYVQSLPDRVRSRFIDDVNGLRMHVLECGVDAPDRPCVVLLHGFPELAFSWRRVLPALGDAGYYALAPDQRGYGRTTGWNPDYDRELGPFRFLNLVRDVLGLLSAVGRRNVAGVVGHDFGSWVAAWCALIRPDWFQTVTLMSAPFSGPPDLEASGNAGGDAIHDALARLSPPRKHYHRYYCTRKANDDLWRAPQGVHDFLRAYFHHKSADWAGNTPHPLAAWTAPELAKMPTYYIMQRDRTMAETVAAQMPSAEHVAQCAWLPDAELDVYASEFERTGFQGGLNWYRCRSDARFSAELELFSGRGIDVPSQFIAGSADWGIYQSPGALEKMQSTACSQMRGCHLIDGAGHWVQQEQPDAVSTLILEQLALAAGAR